VKTLIVEDSATLCAVYTAYLDGTGLDVSVAHTLAEAEMLLSQLAPDLVLLDIELPDGNGLDLLTSVAQLPQQPSVVVMTGHGKEYADDALNRGANDFLSKPFDASRLRVTLMNAADNLAMSRQLHDFKRSRQRMGAMLGSSPTMQAVYATIDTLAASLAPALIVGEPGTGKYLAARLIHEFSERAPNPLTHLEPANHSAEHLMHMLFGRDDASTAALISQAKGGSLFLEEVCDLPLPVQEAVVRLIQTGTYSVLGATNAETADVRIIASTSKDPLSEMRLGRLREDLYYRLFSMPLRMPPLRERGHDAVELTKYFLGVFSGRNLATEEDLSGDLVRGIKRYPWPRNVEQLKRVCELVAARGETIQTVSWQLFEEAIDEAEMHYVNARPEGLLRNSRLGSVGDDRGIESIEPLWVVERRAIEAALVHCGGNIHHAARLLEVPTAALYRKLERWQAAER
jgi:two-component system repressor protein LuxO